MKQLKSTFIFIGNNVAIDFINTVISIRGELTDLIKNRTDLIRWARDAGLNLEVKTSSLDLANVRDLREALTNAYSNKIDDLAPSRKTLAVLNRHLLNYSKKFFLSSNNSDYALQLVRESLTISKFLAYIAYEASVLLASPQALRLKRCNNSDCILIFLDTSRNQKRCWCSMEACGNRAKVATHYKKNRS